MSEAVEPRPPETPLGLTRWSNYPVIGRLVRFFLWWLAFAGIYASSSVCPFCGQPGCLVGVAGAGTVGALFALFLQNGKALPGRLREALPRRRGLKPGAPEDRP